MPTPAYLTITGTVQNDITKGAYTKDSVGNIYKPGHEDEILVQAFNHNVTKPTDSQTGQATGVRVHKPLTITKVFDRSSPLLYKALCQTELLQCVLKWYRNNSDTGQDEHYFTTTLEDALIVNIKAYMPHCQDPANEQYTHMEEVSFTYKKIIWRHEVGPVENSDAWGDY